VNKFQSTKLIDGFSTCYRDWKSKGKNKYLHGSALSFRIWFEGDLDYRNWVADFGLFKRAKNKINGMSPKDYFTYLLDHTTIISADDPYLEQFKQMDKDGIIQLRIMDSTNHEQLTKYFYKIIDNFLEKETNGRVKVAKIQLYKH
jgi:6-pyruvoyltetrahydropterin/6-carboxytetrahydropterin synthase